MKHRLLSACLVALSASAAAAQEGPKLYGGFTATTNYIYRGESQSDDRPALQVYLEGEAGMFYGGAWASTVRLDDDRAELDLYAGVRRSFGDLALDLNYTRYIYDESGDCCGEIGLSLAHPLSETVEIGAAMFVDPEESTQWFEARGSKVLMDDYLIDATLGADFGSFGYDKDKFAWNAGASRSVAELVTLDLRYHDSNLDPARLVGSISLDF